MKCACGKTAWTAGKCRACYWARVNSIVRFGGHREAVMERDEGKCQVCGDPAQLVHHRRYDPQDPLYQLALCRACHARIHRLRTLSKYVPPRLLELWIEANPGKSTQLQFPFE